MGLDSKATCYSNSGGRRALGGWKDVLMRLHGAEACVQKVAKVAQRVVLFDMPEELFTLPAQEVYDFPGGSS